MTQDDNPTPLTSESASHSQKKWTRPSLSKKHVILLSLMVLLFGACAYLLLPTSPQSPHISAPDSDLSVFDDASTPPTPTVTAPTPPPTMTPPTVVKKTVIKHVTLPLDDDAKALVKYASQLHVQKLRQQALSAQLEADQSATQLTQANKVNALPSSSSDTSVETKGVTLPKVDTTTHVHFEPSYMDDVTVSSLVKVADHIEAIVEFQHQFIPVHVGTHIGRIQVLRIDADSVTFKEGKLTQTKWVKVGN